MRFEQLKRDPNNVMRKKLVKSKKNWVVISSLSIAGGLFLLSAPNNIVQAAETTTSSTPSALVSSNSSPSSTGTTSSASAAVSSDKATTASTTQAPAADAGSKQESVSTTVDKQEVAAPEKTTTETDGSTVLSDATATEGTNTNTQPAQQAADATTNETDANDAVTDITAGTQTTDTTKESNPVISNNTDSEKDSAEKTDTVSNTDNQEVTDKDVSKTDTTTETQDVKDSVINPTSLKLSSLLSNKEVISNLSLSEEKLASTLGVSAESLAITPESSILTDGNIAEDLTADIPWHISSDGVLHIGDSSSSGKTMADSTAINTSTVTAKSDGTYDVTHSIEGPISTNVVRSKSAWIDHASAIKQISIDSKINAAANMQYVFADLPNMTTITGLSNLKTDNTTNIEGLFANDTSLTTVDFTGNNLSSATNMSRLFENDSSLTSTLYNKTGTDNTGASIVYKSNVSKVADASYAYANTSKLTDPGLAVWKVTYLKNAAGMFLNDRNIDSLDLSGWQTSTKFDSGDSRIDEGMFDGTNLSSIRLYQRAFFKYYTALTSEVGANWAWDKDKTEDKTETFAGMPTIENETATAGLGKVFDGTTHSVSGSGLDIISRLYTPIAVANGTSVSNLITIPTNLGNVAVTATGQVGENSSVDVPATITVDGITYTTTTKTVTATFGQTMATADTAVDNYVGPAVDAGNITIKDNNGNDLSIPVVAGHVGDKVTVPVTVPDGYTSTTKEITVTYTGDKDNPYSTDTTEITLTGVPSNGERSTISSDGTKGATGTITVPAGEYDGGTKHALTTDDVNIPTGYSLPSDITYAYGTKGEVHYYEGDTEVKISDIKLSGDSISGTTVHLVNPTDSTKTTSVDILGGHVGDATQEINLNDKYSVPGYTAPTITVEYDDSGKLIVKNSADGSVINPTDDLTYTPNTLSKDTTLPLTINLGNSHKTQDSSVQVKAGGVMNTTDENPELPDINGYQAPKVSIKYVADKDGNVVPELVDENNNVVTEITYIGNPTEATEIKVPANGTSDTSVKIPAGNYGDDPVTLDIPDKKGYTKPTVKVVYNSNGIPTYTDGENNPIDLSDIKYTPNDATTKSYTVSVPDGPNGKTKDANVDLTGAKVGDSINLPAPTVDGYTPSANVTGTINENGEFVPDETTKDITYTPQSSTNTSTSVNIKTGQDNTKTQSLDIPAGTMDTTSDPIDLTPITGYKTPQVKIKYVFDKTTGKVVGQVVDMNGDPITAENPAVYIGNDNPATSVTVSGNGTTDSKIAIPAGHYGDPSFELNIPDKTGYTHPNVTVTYGPEGDPIYTDTKTGKPIAISDIKYTGVDAPDASYTYKNADGSTTKVPFTNAKVGDTVSVDIPKVDGYTNSTDKVTGTIDAKGNFQPDPSTPANIYTPQASEATSSQIAIKNGQNTANQTLTIPAGDMGTTSDPIDLTPITGYKEPQVKIKYVFDKTTGKVVGQVVDMNGDPITAENPAVYIGNDNPATSVTVSGNGTTDSKVAIPAGHYGDPSFELNIPDKTGYTHPNVTVTYGPEGDPIYTDTKTGKPIAISDIKYTGVDAPDASYTYKNADGSTTKVPFTNAKVGDTVSVDIPKVDGYTNSTDKVTGTIDAKGNFQPDPSTPANIYTPQASEATSSQIAIKNGQNTANQTLTIPTGDMGTTSDPIDLTPITGYKTPQVKIKYIFDKTTGKVVGQVVDMNGDPITAENPAVYIGNDNPETSVTVSGNGTTDSKVTIPAGHYGDPSFKLDIPDKIGYTHPNVTVTYGPEGDPIYTDTKTGKPIAISDIKYTGVDAPDASYTIDTPDGKSTTTKFPDAKVGDTVSINVPNVDGYKPNIDKITGTINENGTFIPDPNLPALKYTGIDKPGKDTTFTTADGKQTGTVFVQPGKVGDTVLVTAPNIKGYTPNQAVISGKIQPDGSFKPDKEVIYTGNPVTNQSLSIPATKNGSSNPQTISGLSGKVGDTITVNVPKIPGYTADKTTVTATINPDGSITTKDTVTYNRNPSSGNHIVDQPVVTPPTTDNVAPETKHQNVATYGNKPDVQVYSLDDNNAMQTAGTRELVHGSRWFSDQIVTVAGVKYYRVATNEYVKASQVYPYQDVNLTVETHDLTDKPLYDAAGTLIENENLGAYTDWKSDRLVTIDGTDYYRVSTGSFVKASDVNPYQAIKSYVRVPSDIGTEGIQVYNSQGKSINRKVSANSAWFTDRITYINGIKYYRIATDEYVKFDDVAQY